MAAARRHLREWGARLVDLVLPPRCLSCAGTVASPAALCAACWRGLALIERPFCERLGIPFAYDHGPGMLSADAIASPPAYGRARAAVRYEGAAVGLVQRLKYRDRVDVAPLMGRLMTAAGADILAEAEMLIPVPLHPLRLWRRRFNQAAPLCQTIAAATGLPHRPFLVRRQRRTKRQVGLSRAERTANVQGAFRVGEAQKPALRGRRVVLVDDVITTGATIEAVARTLLRAGAAQVDVLVFARVITTTLG